MMTAICSTMMPILLATVHLVQPHDPRWYLYMFWIFAWLKSPCSAFSSNDWFLSYDFIHLMCYWVWLCHHYHIVIPSMSRDIGGSTKSLESPGTICVWRSNLVLFSLTLNRYSVVNVLLVVCINMHICFVSTSLYASHTTCNVRWQNLSSLFVCYA
jgi:hypothetical protein